MKLTINTYFDDYSGEFVGETFAINDEKCSEEDYEGQLEVFEVLEEDEVETCECDSDCCADCEYNETGECDCPECTIEKYIEIIQDIFENTGACGGCIGNALESFMYEIVDHIVIESD